ncbi:SapC family protein [Desulfatibacillum aliphaticivorans]|uniref:SapC family protein n=1 Tax=Desulfatibacillum aliphaticivorans TaxID=218208 RepID=B8FEP9_DESAL|nr:SapC family protein [Desulfatibacillum aliphaticivorans]ACL03576.1 SapC family protein [Desulfatibacillum aliphaticivorans]
MAEQGIYKNPIFLNSVTHKSVKVAPVKDYSFASKLNSVVIVGQEFLEAAKFFPVVFTRAGEDQIVPVAILGLRNEENLFVGKDGKWKEGSYMPAYFRRYPFVLASNVGEDASYAVCVDSNFEGFGKSEGMALFDDDGKQTDEFKRVVQFLQNYQVQHEATKEMVKLLQEYELFKDVSANITLPKGEKIGFGRLLMVDEMGIFNLDDEKIVNLVRTGYLAWIYSHLYSLSNFRSLMGMIK